MAASLKTPDLSEEFLLEDFNLIGRSQDATIRMTDNGVSRQHATIRRDGRLYWLSDLGSANGSFVNDVAVTTALDGGALGARMTGGGFGGCAIALVRQERADSIGTSVVAAFRQREWTDPVPFTVTAARGAGRGR